MKTIILNTVLVVRLIDKKNCIFYDFKSKNLAKVFHRTYAKKNYIGKYNVMLVL